jgi:hypothetical protein
MAEKAIEIRQGDGWGRDSDGVRCCRSHQNGIWRGSDHGFRGSEAGTCEKGYGKDDCQKPPVKKAAKKAVTKKAAKKTPAKKIAKKVAAKNMPAKKAVKKSVKKTAKKAGRRR